MNSTPPSAPRCSQTVGPVAVKSDQRRAVSHDWRRSRQPRRTDAVGTLASPSPSSTGLCERATPRFAAKVREIFEPQYRRLGGTPRRRERAHASAARTRAFDARTTGAMRDQGRSGETIEANDINGDLATRSFASWPPGSTRRLRDFIERYRGAASPQDEQRYLRGLSGFSEERVASTPQ